MKTTQKQRLQNHLDSGQSINRLSALLDLGIFELASRIGELEKDGYPIDKRRTTVTNRFGESISVVVYSKKTNDAKNRAANRKAKKGLNQNELFK